MIRTVVLELLQFDRFSSVCFSNQISGGATPGRARSNDLAAWKIHRPGSALPIAFLR